ncbi:hypothetical protein J1605_016239 [Eschrichtius robustus]|uniref:Uncharacterized protein n=1 Tax=Eschrichtius robustus TaxID=9764 RepID=A0AB34G7L1_ESCRO|nr:hypothetical protein J1605_016239 [Eschrichtius robustus]
MIRLRTGRVTNFTFFNVEILICISRQCLNLLIKIEQTTFPPRFNSLSTRLYEEMENHQKWTENRSIRCEQDHLGHVNQRLKLLQEKLDMSEKKMEEKLLKLSSKLENFINRQKQEADLNKVKHIENKLSKKMNQLEKHIWGELEKMQNEYQSGEQIPLIK